MDQLWVPLLTHYVDGAVAPDRIRRHMASLRPHVRSILVAGSTGDGWELDAQGFGDILETLQDAEAFSSQMDVLIGILRPSTQEVLARLDQAVAIVGRTRPAIRIMGVAVCPPVDADVDQDGIVRHYAEVAEASPWPISLYQLPQVTRCSMDPSTVSTLARHPKVTLFKDSSGADLVARADEDYGDLLLVRGAEGSYVEHLRPKGRYNGWLLSTGNAFAERLRGILRAHADDDAALAAALSQQLDADVAALFEAAAAVRFGNAFSNANRAADHIMAHGVAGWRTAAPPETVGGQPLPVRLLEVAERVVSRHATAAASGYLS